MIIGICGLIGSGKGTVADLLVEKHNFHKVSFADKLKDGVAQVFDWPRDMLEGDTKDSRQWRESEDEFWSKEIGRKITPRYVLQIFGTECMRHGLYDDIWVSLVKKKILDNPDKHWIIPDTRFPNEVKMIKQLGGQVWRIKRGEDPEWFTDYVEGNITPTHAHPSEWMWAKIDFDHTIKNNTTVEDLHNKVEKIISDQQ